MAMPPGTRSSIRANRARNPMTATASLLIAGASIDRLDLIAAGHQGGAEDQAIGPYRDQDDGRHVAGPGQRVERPERQPQLRGLQVVGVSGGGLVEQGPGL